MKEIEFHPLARREADAGSDYYDKERPGYGEEFADELDAAFRLMRTHPLAWPLVSERVHRILLNRFEYGLLYAATERSFYIVAVMHLKRHPDYWKDRIKDIPE